MKLVEINWNPTSRQLRQFALICLFTLPGITWLWGGGLTLVGLMSAAGAALALVGWFQPALIKPLFLGMMIVAAPIGMVVGEIAMLLVFFCVILPISLLFRLTRRDALERRLDHQATTYWRPKKQLRNAASYYRQF